MSDARKALERVGGEIVACRRCARLVEWREARAAAPPRRFAGQRYHARGVPGFGDPAARLLIVGLAPAANGANRTGRMFTGDRSGDWLYRALHRAGFANQPTSVSTDDGLALRDAWITATCRCAPPDNKPTPDEIAACEEYLDREIEALWPGLRVVVPLGAIALKAFLKAARKRGAVAPRPAPKFAHAGEFGLGEGEPRVVMSFHPSQQNTQTGKLTEPMFDQVWSRARELLEK